MVALKPGIVALVLIAGLSGSAHAQKPAQPTASGSYPATQSPGDLSAFYGMTPHFNNYGLSGTFPSYGGYGYPAYGPGAQFGAHYNVPAKATPLPTRNKSSAALKSIPKPTGSPGNATSRTMTPNRKGL